MEAFEHRLYVLLRRYLSGGITAAELEELKGYDSVEVASTLSELLDGLEDQDLQMDGPLPGAEFYERLLMDPRIAADMGEVGKSSRGPRFVNWHWIGGVAAALLAVMAWFVHHQGVVKPVSQTMIASLSDTIMPGGNKATLTLADGNSIILNDTHSGIVMGDDGNAVYHDGTHLTDGVNSSAGALVTLAVPNGGTYQITLADGTRVWLNSASKLTYPTTFTAEERVVFLEGEAYFEVNKKRISASGKREGRLATFRVVTANQTIAVLGTEFNVLAYADGPETRTTLISGMVDVLRENNAVSPVATLRPGQHAVTRGSRTDVIRADIEPFIAWKDGYFAFPDAHITNVMATLARWYDIEVEYQGDMSDRYFGGTLSKFESFETLLKTIELTGSVRFKIVGRRVIVMT